MERELRVLWEWWIRVLRDESVVERSGRGVGGGGGGDGS